MCTCRCRKLRLDPYEDMDVRAKMTAATRAGDWQTARDCFDELEQEYMAMVRAADGESLEARQKQKVAEEVRDKAFDERDAAIAARDKAEEAFSKILEAAKPEVEKAALDKLVDEEITRRERERGKYIASTINNSISSNTAPWLPTSNTINDGWIDKDGVWHGDPPF